MPIMTHHMVAELPDTKPAANVDPNEEYNNRPYSHLIKDIPPEFWADVKQLAAVEHVSIRALIMNGLQLQIDKARAEGRIRR